MQLDPDSKALTSSTAVLVADTRWLIREGIKTSVAAIVGPCHFLEAYEGDSLLRAAARMPRAATQLAFVSLKVPGLHADMVLGEMARRHERIRIVLLESSAPADVVRRAMNVTRVYACVSSNADAPAMRAAIQAALDQRKLPVTRAPDPPDAQLSALTPRQNQIHELLRRGLSNKMIASELSISEGTVKNHMTDILRALNATNRTQAAQVKAKADFQ